jgi:hydrogenase maturation protease
VSPPQILVAGVGNVFLGDDAFGVEVVQRLVRRELDGARVVDFGIRGLDLVYALLDGYEAVILVDAAPRGEHPGTLYLLEVNASEVAAGDAGQTMLDPHRMEPIRVLRLAAAMGAKVRRLFVVGCEPSPSHDPEEMQSGLSEPVRAAVDEAVTMVEALVASLLRGESIDTVKPRAR